MADDTLRIDKALSNPKFEGYKLHLIPQQEGVLRFPLSHKPTQVSAFGKTPLGFQEVQSRITHNHLVVQGELGRALYLDGDYNIILIELGQDRLSPTMRKLYQLPRPIQSDVVESDVHPEYPSAAFANSTVLLVSDGQGTMYALGLDEMTQPSEAVLIGQFTLPSGGGAANPPFRIHHAHGPSPLCLIATLSSRYYPEKPPLQHQDKRHPVEFDVWNVKLNLAEVVAGSRPSPVEILWHRRGEDVPFYATYSQSHQSFLLVGTSEYREPDSRHFSTYGPSPEEIAPAPQAAVSPDTASVLPPYSWTQSSDTVTVAILLPSNTSKDKINVSFSPTTLTFHVSLDSDATTSQSTSIIPRYSAKTLWDGISPSSSYWTFDREAERAFGILSLYLEKQHEGTRWSHLFADAGTGSHEGDIDVPETLDPSELWNIREALEKYTAALQNEDMGLGKGIPSLAENEMDEEIDASVGRTAYITLVSDSSLQTESEPLLRKRHPTPFQLLSTPLPGRKADDISLVIKNNIDGAVFMLEEAVTLESSVPLDWTHTTTYPALAFVLASKRDTRFTYHIPGKAVFAFEGGSSNSGGNIYIYYPAAPKAATSKQAILKIEGGALMGVGWLADSNGDLIITCLTESELMLIKGI